MAKQTEHNQLSSVKLSDTEKMWKIHFEYTHIRQILIAKEATLMPVQQTDWCDYISAALFTYTPIGCETRNFADIEGDGEVGLNLYSKWE